MITGKIDVTKVLKDHLYQGKSAKYLDLVLWPLKQGPDDHGNTHIICQSLSKEARAKGEKGPILGRMKIEGATAPAAATETESDASDPGDDVPF